MNIRTLTTRIVLVMKKHYVAIIAALVISLIIVAPQIAFISSLGSDYEGLYLMNTDAETHYLARIQEVYDGFGNGNPYIAESKSLPSPLYTFSEAILAYPGIVLGISAADMNLAYKFILPFIVALLIYSLLYRLIGNKPWSASGAILLMLGYSLVNIPDILHLLRLDRYYTDLIMYSRPVNPQLSSIFFFVYLHIMLSIFRGFELEGKKSWKRYLVLAIVLGLAFYIYLYSFTFFLALNATCIPYFLIRKDRQKSWGMIGASIFGSLIGLGFIIHMVRLSNHPLYAQLAETLGLESSRFPIISLAGVVALIIFLIYYYRSQKSATDNFILCLLITTFVVINQQIITGKMIQTGHYHWYFNSPIYMMAIVYAVFNFLKDRPKQKYILVAIPALLVIVSVADASFIQYSAYNSAKERTAENQRYMPLMKWLNENTLKESVVFANEAISELIPVFTSNNVVWSGAAQFYLVSPERREFYQEKLIESGLDLTKFGRFRIDYLVRDPINDEVWKMPVRTFKKIGIVDKFEIFEVMNP